MKGISYLLCLLFIAPLLTGCFGNNEQKWEHDEALVGDWYIADEVVISFYSNGTVTGYEGRQGTWSTSTEGWGGNDLILDLNFTWSKILYYSVDDGWLIVLRADKAAPGEPSDAWECDAVSKDSISVENWNTTIEELEKLAIEPKTNYPCHDYWFWILDSDPETLGY